MAKKSFGNIGTADGKSIEYWDHLLYFSGDLISKNMQDDLDT